MLTGEFDPNDAINLWFNDKIRRLTAAQDKSSSEKRQRLMRMSMLTLPR